MKLKITHMVIVLLLGMGNLKAQKWTVYNTDNSMILSNGITDIAIDAQNNKWVATYFGISKFNGKTWTNYDVANSGLASNNCNTISIDINGNIWIGTENGISKFDGSKWTTYLPIPYGGGPARARVLSITCDSKGNIWFGHPDCFVSKFDGTNWSTFSISTPLANNDINCMAVDGQDNLWFSVSGRAAIKLVGSDMYNLSGLILDDEVTSIAIDKQKGMGWFGSSLGTTSVFGSTWKQYSFLDNDNFPYSVSTIAIDKQGNNWFGWANGLTKFDGSTWTTLSTSNSGLPYERVSKVVVDANGILWLGNYGLVKYNPNDKSGIEEHNMVHTVQIYPNPTADKLFIKGTNPNLQVLVFNTNGQLILTQEMTSNTLDFSDLVAGLYSIYIVDANGVSVHKILKK